jgi:hypothetical protein
MKEAAMFDEKYPNITAFVQDGWIEIGRDEYSPSFIRAIDLGGMVWEGATKYPSLDAALDDLETGLAAWFRDVMGEG